ncbi:60S ribosomal protein L13 [Neolecta irregularis DAH-3]|uniref:60S ribosomal protein L13 n=1 Tax=Neolecta irregularis (strain DAH-3) TaxID=1198029 RepID=A0A1U7LR34_NEOID|nr:60S ribosomal protein L13 [Neolecta irregularis DAH-3]|eukprot:OLL25125.1 60S ribosomal protein L13 [Neolecta irregularis DAH-3]
MAIKGNRVLPNAHFRKQWQKRVRCWFDQPARKYRRRQARVAKVCKVAPRPVDHLRPAVRSATLRYNMKLQEGRGFTLEELKVAGIPVKFAKTIGISVDHRRRNKSQESLDLNVARLKSYKSSLILFPRKKGSVKRGDTEDVSAAQQIVVSKVLPISQDIAETERNITKEDKEFNAYATLRKAQSVKKYKGKNDLREKKRQEEEEIKKK